MDSGYPEIQGVEISLDEVTIERVKSIALAMKNHPYIKLLQVIKTTEDNEILLSSFDIQIPQNPVNDIREAEVVAIICDRENLYFPLVLALRTDFPLGLPHTNLRPEEHPVSLCVSEQTYKEIKHQFNPFWYLESIREWFRLTSKGLLHGEDQPLESLYHPDGYIIIPDIDNIQSTDNYYIRELCPHPKVLRLDKAPTSSNNTLLCLVIPTDSQVPGFIKKKPTRIFDIKDLLIFKGQSFLNGLLESLNVVKKDLPSVKRHLDKNIGLLCLVPVKRHSSDRPIEDIKVIFITLNVTLKKIGELLGIWEEHNGELALLFSEYRKLKVLDDIPIALFSTILDFSPQTAGFFNGEVWNNYQYSIIGAGAYGSNLINNLSRMGFGHWTIIDNDILFPHNLARHLLGRNEIGKNKATALSCSINHLLGETSTSSLELDFIEDSSKVELLNVLKSSEAIIDTSTSIAVARKLALDYSEEVSARRISMFLSPSGNDSIILAEDSERIHRLDLLEMQYYREIYNEPTLRNHLVRKEINGIRYASNSCRDITQRISQDNVALHSSIGSKVLKAVLYDGQATIKIWRIVDEPLEIKTHEFSPSIWKKFDCGGWTIFIDSWVINKMVEHRQSALPNETGGVLIGAIDTQRKILYLIDTILAPDDSVQKPTEFIRGKDGITTNFQEYLTITDNQVLYLGEWHSHPNDCSTKPSRADKLLFSYLSEQLSQQGYPTLMLIVGDTSMNLIFELI